MSGSTTMVPSIVVPPPPAGERFPAFPEGEVHCLNGEAMGTTWRLSVVLAEESQLPLARMAVERALAMVIAQMSQWEAESEISRFNRAAADSAMILSPAFAKVLDCALAIARASGGAFDPTLGSATDRWGFGPSALASVMHEPREYAGPAHWRALTFDPKTRRLVQPGGVQLDLSGIAKGFAVDLVALLLDRAGLSHHLIEIGGEVRGCGLKPDRQPWWVDLEPVPDAEQEHWRIALSGWSVATSGDWHRRRSAGGRSWSHSLSPETHAPVDHGTRAATVLHRECMQADALATVLMVLPLVDALTFANGHGIAARLVCGEGKTRTTAAWQAML